MNDRAQSQPVNVERIYGSSDAVSKIAGAMLKAAGAEMERHSANPDALAMLLAAVKLCIVGIDRDIDPGFRGKVIEMLEPRP